jgi:hypothetical protein
MQIIIIKWQAIKAEAGSVNVKALNPAIVERNRTPLKGSA